MTNSPDFPSEFERALSEMGLSADEIFQHQRESPSRLSEAGTEVESEILTNQRINTLYWLYKEGERDFSGIDLSGVKRLIRIDLSSSNLASANLSSTNLSQANLSNTNLQGSDLSNAELAWANLSGADLTQANLNGANLYRANLTGAILTEAGLKGTNFSGCLMPNGSPHSTKEVQGSIARFKRSAWKPIVEEGDCDVRSSKFAGKPWLSAEKGWPLCPICDNPMRFFFQINLDKIPEELGSEFGKGMLQFFYCAYEKRIEHSQPTSKTGIIWSRDNEVRYVEHQSCQDPRPFAINQLVRIVPIEGTPGTFEIPETICPQPNAREGEFVPKRIVGWQQFDDYPDYSDYEIFRHEDDPLPDDYYDLVASAAEPPEIDKLAGWPLWVQYAEYPNCPTCQQPMNQLVFQLVSDDNIPFLWGDCGIGYLLQCPDHKDQVTFLSQCG